MPDEEYPINDETPALQVLKQIKEGTYDPKTLPSEMRQDLVEHLWYVEGQAAAVIAQILKVSDKTIQRDKDAIRERNAKKLTPEDRLKILGELLEKATSAHENLIRLSRSKDGSLQEKGQTAYFAAKAIQEQVELLQSLGYFPLRPTQIDADIRYTHEEETTPAKLKEELARLEKIASGKNVSDPEVTRLMEEMRYHIAIAEAKERRVKLEDKINDITKDKDSPSA